MESLSLYAGAVEGHGLNIFMVEIGGGSALLTPHEGEKMYGANDASPDGRYLLITPNAGNGYDNAGLLDITAKKIQWLTQIKWEIAGDSFSPDGKSLLYMANVDGNNEIYSYDVASGRAYALPFPKGLNWPDGPAVAFYSRWIATALHTYGSDCSWLICGSIRFPSKVGRRKIRRWTIASAYAFAGRRRTPEKICRAATGALLSEQGWQVDDLRVRLCSIQLAAQRRDPAIVYVTAVLPRRP